MPDADDRTLLDHVHHQRQAALHLAAVETMGYQGVGDAEATFRLRLAELHIALAQTLCTAGVTVEGPDPDQRPCAGGCDRPAQPGSVTCGHNDCEPF